MKYMHIYKLP